MSMTPEAKRQLSSTIRALRARLLQDLHAATEQAYRLSVRARDAGLSEAARVRRGRLEAWLTEQVRAQEGTRQPRTGDEFRGDVERQAAYTLLNRVVLLRLMEASGLRAPPVITGGWESSVYKALRELAPALARAGDVARPEERDETEGYAFLLRLVFEDLAVELPGLFGPAGVAELVPLPAATLRYLVEALGEPGLASCWTDDMTLGWVYQYWNDPEREVLDAKLLGGEQLEPHEIASKTQIFTERYMVDWLLQNSLGPMWLATCRQHGWTADVERADPDGTPSLLDRLEARRAEWRGRRERGDVSLTELMPLEGEAERRWAYYVPQHLPEEAVKHAPASVRDLRLLDPAVGSGHFLVVALDMLFGLYREEARHRGLTGDSNWSDRAIVEHILSYNLHGIDLDARAIQIAAAALWLKARQLSPNARPELLNLVASNLRLASLPDDDPALLELRREVERETGLPAALTDTIVHALRGADHLGSLLKVDAAVDAALDAHEAELAHREATQGVFFGNKPAKGDHVLVPREEARATLLGRLEGFLSRHSSGDDLGLRLRGEQLAAGVRFVRMTKEASYHIAVGNPPYQGTAKLSDAAYVQTHYEDGKADLFAAFLERALALTSRCGLSAMITMRNWMFIKQYSALRLTLLSKHRITAIGDLSWGAFKEMKDNPVTMAVVRRGDDGRREELFPVVCATDPVERVRTLEEVERKNSGLICQNLRYQANGAAFGRVGGSPLVYWWDQAFLETYSITRKLGETASVGGGANTGANSRLNRAFWEVAIGDITLRRCPQVAPKASATWLPYIKGGRERAWIEPLVTVIKWQRNGLEAKLNVVQRFGEGGLRWKICNESYYFLPGVAFSPIGDSFRARAHRFSSIIDMMGQSVYKIPQYQAVCLLHSAQSRFVVRSLNPTVHFQVLDIRRIPMLIRGDEDSIFAILDEAFARHESHRETSVEFSRPGASAWCAAQSWAQSAVDRIDSAPLASYSAVFDSEGAADHVSYALGVALGRFGPNGEGIRDPRPIAHGGDDVSFALPDGILFLDGTLSPSDRRDSMGHPAAERLHAAWSEHRIGIDTSRKDVRDYLRLDFFKVVHRAMYENRPIHWPLSSAEKTFVAWVTIHRWTAKTLTTLLADHLEPALRRLDGALQDLRDARLGKDAKAARKAEDRFSKVQNWREELTAFIASVEACAERGPPPTDPSPKTCPPRECDTRYEPDLDDGVMINSAALWPLLEPQWKDPKKWWKELALPSGKKDYDWSHLAMRYWPTRVDGKCKKDPSLGVAHGCFWRYHPAQAWAWELRLQDEIGPDFRIDEAPYRPGGRDGGDPGSTAHRAAWLRDHTTEALAAVEKEAVRRMGRGKARKVVSELRLLEPGLWSALPEGMWALELRLSERQGAELRVLAPDEAAARSAYSAAHPALAADRVQRIAGLVPPELFEDPGGDEEEESAAAEEDEGDAE